MTSRSANSLPKPPISPNSPAISATRRSRSGPNRRSSTNTSRLPWACATSSTATSPRTILLQSGYEAQPLPILIGTWPQSRPILPNLYALGAGTTAVTLALIFAVLVVFSLRLRLRGAPVESVEEEFGEEPGGSMRIDAIGKEQEKK